MVGQSNDVGLMYLRHWKKGYCKDTRAKELNVHGYRCQLTSAIGKDVTRFNPDPALQNQEVLLKTRWAKKSKINGKKTIPHLNSGA